MESTQILFILLVVLALVVIKMAVKAVPQGMEFTVYKNSEARSYAHFPFY